MERELQKVRQLNNIERAEFQVWELTLQGGRFHNAVNRSSWTCKEFGGFCAGAPMTNSSARFNENQAFWIAVVSRCVLRHVACRQMNRATLE